MVKSIKIKNGNNLQGLINDPIKLSILVQLSFSLNEKDEAFYKVPFKWVKKFDELIVQGLVKKTEKEGFYSVSGDFIEKPKKAKKKKQDLVNKQLLAGAKIVPQDLKIYYDIAVMFQKLFYKNLKSINARTKLVENAKFGNWVTPIKLMITRDKVTKEQFRQVYDFIEKEQFWFYNCQSTSKLREKFNTIHTQANGKQQQQKNGNGGSSKTSVSPDYLAGVFKDLQS